MLGYSREVASVPGLSGKDSGATAVAVDANGAIIVAGYYKNGIAFRRYIAKLNENGTLLGGEDDGLVDGEEIMGLAVSKDGDIVAAGSLRTSPLDQNPLYDAVFWGYPGGNLLGADKWTKLYERPDTEPPDPMKARTERARAVVALSNEQFGILGEREVKGDDNYFYSRSFIVRFGADGENLGHWTSDGAKFMHDAALTGLTTDAGFLVAGWCKNRKDGHSRVLHLQSGYGSGCRGDPDRR